MARCAVREEGLRAAALPRPEDEHDEERHEKQTRHVNFYLLMITRLDRSLPLYPGISFWLSTALLNIGGFIVGPPGHQAL